ncbi:glycerophosphodiester phosphodiesterase [Peribacillus psychrosaccharolyticus]|uniref:Glycerophosphodiester phosphodiesterase n=1 Tax=Peribacillus psychrosaccharolyticus TaxID=1407 RepID=A0A974NLK3_PERPY|nr:glycerophosphodiester phosphodiesterase [Peribacillus psychrosaccharolyticus]MEC2056858.1 glycerophosphodiester phosphodiesterase [Peribacillus psychrosaccharolyticus]MED3746440.1 glycerophosphodiester phosphodiesterase [Peribacillus psychrosaccharolyticus]QQT00020.1 glycerophosphodiester phosphodiesterase [Peribacillus psychrosaccharolyticus]
MKIFAHRGAAGTYPENTMVAFIEAKRSGADGIELDVQLSKDGIPVVIHDETLNRTTNGSGFVKDQTMGDMKKLNAGYKFGKQLGRRIPIPSLQEVFEWIQSTDLLCNIELKNGVYLYPGLEEKVIQLVRGYGLEERVILSSFNHYSLVYAWRLAPEIETAPLYRDGIYMPWVYASSIGSRGMHPSIHAVPDALIIDAMAYGIQVRPYTINGEEDIKRLLSINCSAIITDFPERAVRIRELNRSK